MPGDGDGDGVEIVGDDDWLFRALERLQREAKLLADSTMNCIEEMSVEG